MDFLRRNKFKPYYSRKRKFESITDSSISRIFRQPFYAGYFYSKALKKEIPHVYPTIITREEFKLIQDKMRGKRKQTNHYKKRNPDFPLRASARCSVCGNKVRGHNSKGRTETYPYYACHKTPDCIKVYSYRRCTYPVYRKSISNLAEYW